jgi:hypothetical protein
VNSAFDVAIMDLFACGACSAGDGSSVLAMVLLKFQSQYLASACQDDECACALDQGSRLASRLRHQAEATYMPFRRPHIRSA